VPQAARRTRMHACKQVGRRQRAALGSAACDGADPPAPDSGGPARSMTRARPPRQAGGRVRQHAEAQAAGRARGRGSARGRSGRRRGRAGAAGGGRRARRRGRRHQGRPLASGARQLAAGRDFASFMAVPRARARTGVAVSAARQAAPVPAAPGTLRPPSGLPAVKGGRAARTSTSARPPAPVPCTRAALPLPGTRLHAFGLKRGVAAASGGCALSHAGAARGSDAERAARRRTCLGRRLSTAPSQRTTQTRPLRRTLTGTRVAP